jgi:hypothetical protein
MPVFYEIRRQSATLIFDLKDQFAQKRGTRGAFPRPFEPIRFFATAKGAGPNRRVFKPALELVMRRNHGGYHIFHNQVKQTDGTILRGTLTDDVYDLRIEGNFYQTAERQNVQIPTNNRALDFDLFPAYSYPFPTDLKPTGGRGFALLRGSVHSAEGLGLANATVSVMGANSPYVTDTSGQWVLVFPDSFFAPNQITKTVIVEVTPPGGPAFNVPDVDVDKGKERALGETALRGWVVRKGLAVAGATVEVQGRPDKTTTGVEGSWFYYFGLDQPHPSTSLVDVKATLPDGSTLTQSNQQVRSRATIVLPPFQFS